MIGPEVQRGKSLFSVWSKSRLNSAGSESRNGKSQKLLDKLARTKGNVFLLDDDDTEKDRSKYFPLDLQSLFDFDRLSEDDKQRQTNDLGEDKPEFNVLNQDGDLLAIE